MIHIRIKKLLKEVVPEKPDVLELAEYVLEQEQRYISHNFSRNDKYLKELKNAIRQKIEQLSRNDEV